MQRQTAQKIKRKLKTSALFPLRTIPEINIKSETDLRANN